MYHLNRSAHLLDIKSTSITGIWWQRWFFFSRYWFWVTLVFLFFWQGKSCMTSIKAFFHLYVHVSISHNSETSGNRMLKIWFLNKVMLREHYMTCTSFKLYIHFMLHFVIPLLLNVVLLINTPHICHPVKTVQK